MKQPIIYSIIKRDTMNINYIFNINLWESYIILILIRYIENRSRELVKHGTYLFQDFCRDQSRRKLNRSIFRSQRETALDFIRYRFTFPTNINSRSILDNLCMYNHYVNSCRITSSRTNRGSCAIDKLARVCQTLRSWLEN